MLIPELWLAPCFMLTLLEALLTASLLYGVLIADTQTPAVSREVPGGKPPAFPRGVCEPEWDSPLFAVYGPHCHSGIPAWHGTGCCVIVRSLFSLLPCCMGPRPPAPGRAAEECAEVRTGGERSEAERSVEGRGLYSHSSYSSYLPYPLGIGKACTAY